MNLNLIISLITSHKQKLATINQTAWGFSARRDESLAALRPRGEGPLTRSPTRLSSVLKAPANAPSLGGRNSRSCGLICDKRTSRVRSWMSRPTMWRELIKNKSKKKKKRIYFRSLAERPRHKNSLFPSIFAAGGQGWLMRLDAFYLISLEYPFCCYMCHGALWQ